MHTLSNNFVLHRRYYDASLNGRGAASALHRVEGCEHGSQGCGVYFARLISFQSGELATHTYDKKNTNHTTTWCLN